jgi:CheY-like chemotaxis protein
MILVAHDAPSIREVTRHLLESLGWPVEAVADGAAVRSALGRSEPPKALVLDVALGGVLAYELVDEVRRAALPTRVVLIASIYNRTGYKRRPTSLYGADDYVEQHHIPDQLPVKLARLIGEPPRPPRTAAVAAPHADTPEARAIRSAAEERLEHATPMPVTTPATAGRDPIERAQRLARLIVADVALYNGDAFDRAAGLHAGDPDGRDDGELEARLRMDLEEGRLLFDLRVPVEIRRTRDFIREAIDELLAERRRARGLA